MKDHTTRLAFKVLQTYVGRQGYAYSVQVQLDGKDAGTMEDRADGGIPFLRTMGKEQHALGKEAEKFANSLWEEGDEAKVGYDGSDEVLSMLCAWQADKHDAAEMERV